LCDFVAMAGHFSMAALLYSGPLSPNSITPTFTETFPRLFQELVPDFVAKSA